MMPNVESPKVYFLGLCNKWPLPGNTGHSIDVSPVVKYRFSSCLSPFPPLTLAPGDTYLFKVNDVKKRPAKQIAGLFKPCNTL